MKEIFFKFLTVGRWGKIFTVLSKFLEYVEKFRCVDLFPVLYSGVSLVDRERRPETESRNDVVTTGQTYIMPLEMSIFDVHLSGPKGRSGNLEPCERGHWQTQRRVIVRGKEVEVMSEEVQGITLPTNFRGHCTGELQLQDGRGKGQRLLSISHTLSLDRFPFAHTCVLQKESWSF